MGKYENKSHILSNSFLLAYPYKTDVEMLSPRLQSIIKYHVNGRLWHDYIAHIPEYSTLADTLIHYTTVMK